MLRNMPEHLIREPMYQQLNQLLRSLIRPDEFPVGSKFLTERQIAERFDVSRVTANKALSGLVAEGLLEFRKGVGTFVRDRPMEYNPRALASFTDEATAEGKRPLTRVLRFELLKAAKVLDEVPSLLQVAESDELFYMERLRLVDDVPVILERRYVVAAHCEDLSEEEVSGAIYATWSEKYGLSIEGADQSIRAVNIRGEDARIFDVPHGAAGLLVVSTGFLAGRRPLWFERTLYRGDAYELLNTLGPPQKAGTPLGKFL